MPERAAPRVGERRALDGGQQVDQHPVQRGEDRRVAVLLGPDPRAEVVRRPAAAERQPVVAGPLAVDDEVPVVGEGLAGPQPDPVPDVRAERLGRHHQGVDRCEGPAQPGQLGGEALGGADHDLGADPAGRGRHDARARSAVTGVCSCTVTPSRSTARARPRTSRAGWTAAQCGVYVAPSTPAAASRARASSAPSSARSSSPKPHRRASATSARARSSCCGVRASDDGAALGEPAVDVLGGDHLRDLVEGRLHRAVLGDGPLARRTSPRARPPMRGTAPSTSRRCGRSRRSRRPRARARRRAGSGRPA